MTNPSDSDPEGGTLEAPSSSGSNQQGGEQSSGQVTLSKGQLDQLLERIAKVERGAQSEKDRAVKRTNERMDKLEGDIRQVLERASKEGKSVDDMLKEIDQEEEAEFRRNVSRLAQVLPEGKLPAAPVGNGQAAGEEAAKVIEALKLDANSAEVNKIVAAHGNNPAQLAIELAKHAVEVANRPAPSPSAAPAMTGGSAVPEDQGAMISRLSELQKQPTKNKEKIEKLIRELGW